jgi:hypothetical protein
METRTMVGAGAPPPPSEVKVRTMKSDLASMAKSGGGMPSFQSVEVNNLSVEKEYTTPSHAVNMATPVEMAQPVAVVQPVQPTQPTVTQPIQTVPVQQFQPAGPAQVAPPQQPAFQQPPASQVLTVETAPRKDFYPIFIVAVVALLAIGGVGYFAYITFFAGTSPTATTPTQTAALPVVTATTTPTSTAVGSVPTTPTAPTTPSASSQAATLTNADELSSAHVSLFKKPADQTIAIDLSDISPSSYRKIMLNSLATANAASSIIEISPKADDGASINIQGLFSVAGTSLFNEQTLASFNPDATFFVYHDKSGLWPGYVLAMNAGQSSSSVAAAVEQLEQSDNIGNLFLTPPGTPSSDGFTDSTSAGVPVRVLPFSGISFPFYFSYGWYGNNLILSTSNNGFTAAVAGLQ